MKRILSIIFTFIILVFAFSFSVFASVEEQSYKYELSVDGRSEKNVRTGDIITVTLYLNRTDSNEDYTMYSMQNEIRYDSNFFELVEGSEILADGIKSTDIAANDSYREFYMNFLSLSGGETWNAKKQIGSFQLRVIAESGSSTIRNGDYIVALSDGSGSYACEANELTITIAESFNVYFETNGGTEIAPVTAIIGEKLTKPITPTKADKYFAGWYKDSEFKEKWDFETDSVTSEMTLYAKWSDTPVNSAGIPMRPPVQSETDYWSWVWWILIVLFVLIVLVIIL